MPAIIQAIEYHLPESVLDNAQLAQENPAWTVEKIQSKTGILERHVSAPDECASDLAAQAVARLFEQGACRPDEIDFLLFCTQSPDYFLPTTACLLQERLGLRKSVGALDINLGCSGFIYGLGLAKGLIETGQANTVLLLTADTYTKFIQPRDFSVRSLFGDAAAATLLTRGSSDDESIGPFVYGTDGSGAGNLIVKYGGLRHPSESASSPAVPVAAASAPTNSNSDEQPQPPTLYMNGPEIFAFTLGAVPKSVNALLARTGLTLDDIDLVVFHQANEYMLEHLRAKMKIPKEKFFVSMSHCGNTVSSSIPIALRDACSAGRLVTGNRVMLVGFGVGYSWGATLLRWAV